MKKILFFYPNTTNHPAIASAVPILSGIAKEHGWDVSYFDTSDYQKPLDATEEKEVTGGFMPGFTIVKKEMIPSNRLVSDLQSKIDEVRPDIIAISVMSDNYQYLMTFWDEIVIPEKTVVIIGGIHVIVRPDEIIGTNLFDLVCTGQGEEVFDELIHRLEEDVHIGNIDGTWFYDREDNKIYRNPMRVLSKNVWSIDPDYSLYDDRYFTYPFDGKMVGMCWINTSRGCPYDCSYCGNTVLKHVYRGLGRYIYSRPVDSVFRTLRGLCENHKIDVVNITDECFLAHNKEWLEKFAEQYSKYVKKPFLIQTRMETVTRRNLDILMTCGSPFFQVGMGVECIHPDTYIYNSDGTIEKILSNNSNKILSINNNLTQESSTCIKVSKNNIEFVKVRTHTREIICSRKHKFLCLTDNGIEWKEIKTLKKGDYVGIIKNIDIQNDKIVNNILSSDVCEIIGYYIGDGNYHNAIRLSDEKIDVINYFNEKIKKYNIKTSVNDERKYKKNSYTLYLRKDNFIEKYIINLKLNILQNKRFIPKDIMSTTNDNIFSFLRGLFEADGTINTKSKPVISFSTSSKRLAEELKMLMIKVGIETTNIYEKNNPYGKWYVIGIQQKNSIKKFDKYIGFISKFKKDRLKKLIEKENMNNNLSHNETIPLTKKLWLGFLKENNTSANKIYKNHKISLTSKIYGTDDKPQRKLLKQIIEMLHPEGEISNLIKNLVESENVGWQKIVDIQSEKFGEAYDYNVPIISNYIANGFIVHNSGSEKILFDVCNRRTKIKDIIKAYDLLNEYSIRSNAYFMIGLPYETRDDIFKTIDLCRRINSTINVVSIFQPLPGQELTELCLREGFITGREPFATFTGGSVLKMPQISAEEISNLRRTFMLYAKLPVEYYPEIEKCERDYANNRQLFKELVELRWKYEKIKR